MMERRSVMKYLASSAAVAAVGGSYLWLTAERDHAHLALDATFDRLDKLQLGSVEGSGAWELPRVFEHLAQSIEFSMLGFPTQKSPVFQNTVGKLAFSVFNARGEMSHSLSEPIPGEIVAEKLNTKEEALSRLKKSLTDFQKFEAPLKPHFAYGALDKQQYGAAHVMHINNHLTEFGVA